MIPRKRQCEAGWKREVKDDVRVTPESDFLKY